MTTTVNYPSNLPYPQRASQNMTQDTPFMTVQPSVGPPIFIEQTSDLKSTWSLTWIFTLLQSQIFKSWLRSPNYCNNGNAWFNMAIDLGDMNGVQMQELHFTSMPLQSSKDGLTVTWTATVIAKQIVDVSEDVDDIIVMWGSDISIFDIALNKEWPLS